MPKKAGEGKNSKAAAAREEKEDLKDAKSKAAAAKEEDEYWESAGAGKKGKKDLKKDSKDAEKQDTASRKAEAKKLAEQEEAEMSTYGKKPTKVAAPKVTAAERAKLKEKEEKEQEAAIEKKKRELRREQNEDEAASLLDRENLNRVEQVDASGINAAVSAMEISSAVAGAEDSHPERRRKAAYATYEERMLEELKEEKPGLKQKQYKDMIFKSWKKAPENPMNQPRAL